MFGRLLGHIVFGLLMLIVICALPGSTSAQQNQVSPTNPQASAQSEQQLLDQSHRIKGRGTLRTTSPMSSSRRAAGCGAGSTVYFCP